METLRLSSSANCGDIKEENSNRSWFRAYFGFSMETMELLSSANGTNDGEEEMGLEPNSNIICY